LAPRQSIVDPESIPTVAARLDDFRLPQTQPEAGTCVTQQWLRDALPDNLETTLCVEAFTLPTE